MFDCKECDGSGCSACNYIGNLRITECPLDYITSDVWQVIKSAELYKKGLPVVGTCQLDQAQNFIEACRFIWAEQNFWKNKLKIF